MKILITEAGSSKSDWCLLNNGIIEQEFTTAGINPTTQSKSNILSVVEIAKQKLKNQEIQAIYFYGAGCKGAGKIMIHEILNFGFSDSNVFPESDLLAAARSSCNGNPGIVAILGTGSHSCLSDGHNILHEKPSLGYLLGDEGSGNYYGKKILRAYYYKQLDEELIKEFESEHNFIHDHYLSALYSSPKLSFELAQFFPFIIKYKNHPQIFKILEEGIEDFYNQRISHYSDKTSLPTFIVGSVGMQLQEEYIQFLNKKGFNQIYFNSKPIQGLINYHTQYAGN